MKKISICKIQNLQENQHETLFFLEGVGIAVPPLKNSLLNSQKYDL